MASSVGVATPCACSARWARPGAVRMARQGGISFGMIGPTCAMKSVLVSPGLRAFPTATARLPTPTASTSARAWSTRASTCPELAPLHHSFTTPLAHSLQCIACSFAFLCRVCLASEIVRATAFRRCNCEAWPELLTPSGACPQCDDYDILPPLIRWTPSSLESNAVLVRLQYARNIAF